MGSQAVFREELLKSKLLNSMIGLTYPKHQPTQHNYGYLSCYHCGLMCIEMRIEMQMSNFERI
jgi:hypothetical protein